MELRSMNHALLSTMKFVLIATMVASCVITLTSSDIVFAQTPTGESTQTVQAVKDTMKGALVRLENATVETIKNTTLTVTTNGKTYDVTVTPSTAVRRYYFGKALLSEFNTSDSLTIIGTYADDTGETITARLVRNTSIIKLKGIIFGKVTSKSVNKITIDSKERGTQTITVSPTTKYMNQTTISMTLAEVETGDLIRVRGMWDKEKSTITEVAQIKDFSHKTISSPTP